MERNEGNSVAKEEDKWNLFQSSLLYAQIEYTACSCGRIDLHTLASWGVNRTGWQRPILRLLSLVSRPKSAPQYLN
jgi:hypothetical protein